MILSCMKSFYMFYIFLTDTYYKMIELFFTKQSVTLSEN